MKKTVSLFVAFMMLAMCVLPAAPAEASVGGDHTIEMREFPFYLTDPDITLSDPFPLYFIDGVDDLPYIEIEDLAGLLAFLNTDEYFGNDPDYGLNIDYNSEIVTLTRENGYTMEINFEKDTMVFDDYDAFIHGSNDTTLLDLVSEKGFDSEGNPSLIMRDKEASFDRYGDVLAIDLAGYDIDLLVKEQKYLIPLQTMSDFLFAVPLGNCVIFNGEALFLASDDALFDYSVGDYSALSDIFYSVEPRDERSDELAEYSYSELCLLLDTFYGLKEPHDIKNFSQIFWQIGYDEPLRGKSASDADIALKSFIDYYLDDLHSVFNEFSPMVGLNPISSSTGMSNRKITDFGKEYAAARAVEVGDGGVENVAPYQRIHVFEQRTDAHEHVDDGRLADSQLEKPLDQPGLPGGRKHLQDRELDKQGRGLVAVGRRAGLHARSAGDVAPAENVGGRLQPVLDDYAPALEVEDLPALRLSQAENAGAGRQAFPVQEVHDDLVRIFDHLERRPGMAGLPSGLPPALGAGFPFAAGILGRGNAARGRIRCRLVEGLLDEADQGVELLLRKLRSPDAAPGLFAPAGHGIHRTPEGYGIAGTDPGLPCGLL